MLGNFSSGCHKIANTKVGTKTWFFACCCLLSEYVFVSCAIITIWIYFLSAKESSLLCRRCLHSKREYKRGGEGNRSIRAGSPTEFHGKFQPLY